MRAASPVSALRARTSFAAPLAFLGLFATGCHPALNMTSAYDAQRPALTIPYTGIREDLRQYPDYGSIGAIILVEEKPPAPKKGRP